MVRALAFLPVAAAVLSISFVAPSAAFMPTPSGVSVSAHGPNGSGAGETTNSIRNCKTRISAADDGSSTETKAAPQVTGEELELMLQEWDTPLVVDAYATWCGPCLLMAPEFEEAAKELEGKVRFVKIDTDLEPEISGRLGIMGLPTLLFLGKNEDTAAVEEGKAPMAVLKQRIEGALQKKNIVDVCNFVFFDGPQPTLG
mmetsp:Transcript_20105/g.47267  ORF Transcript_20105/g.47267 Transcript_20105/m.47267 type:complete len:200 (-) Transcript_20105:260-859(-)